MMAGTSATYRDVGFDLYMDEDVIHLDESGIAAFTAVNGRAVPTQKTISVSHDGSRKFTLRFVFLTKANDERKSTHPFQDAASRAECRSESYKRAIPPAQRN